MVVAIVPAAGKGVRIKNKIGNKLFINIHGKPIIFYTLYQLDTCKLIDEIYLILDKENIKAREEQIESFKIQKLKKIIVGGNTRGESVYNGLKAIEGNPEIILIHDGARPFISHEKIQLAIETAKEEGACILGIPLSDTLKETDEGYIKKTISRERYIRAQTPQVFKSNIIIKAYERIGESKQFKNTDDAYLVEEIGHRIKIIEGNPESIKITTPFDLKIADIILKEREKWNI